MKFSKFFSNLQEAPWYRDFLNPVIDEIKPESTLLDIGTGSGKFIQILATEKKVTCSGVDTDSGMLEEAKIKLGSIKAELVKIEPNEKLPFENNTFDYVTICSVLFHLKKEDIDTMIADSLQLLTEKGKIIVLTPTGKRNILTLSLKYFSIKNVGIYVWYRATKNRAKAWGENQHLKHYADENNLEYQSKIVMNGFAQLETISQKH